MLSPLNTHSAFLKGKITLIVQVSGLCLFAWLCQWAAHSVHSVIPGSVIGLGVLLILLSCQWLPEKVVNQGSAWLIGDLLLFFIPPVVAVTKYKSILENYGAELIMCMLLASTSVLLGTAVIVDKLFKFERKQRLNNISSQRSHLK
ncbi:CidA/LrgA family protein [Shewanella psychromarinicola]|uniref:CidA/LrgA family protein n=1 Tax=Shewanella psychromarinicola TaxID=2487742 RepID=A0A3N4D967_9GAMM|nr:CidA/LrgA family protein [Shewanella psychromarinicola]AZG35648.1 CidA/LrgA family protein [Shewanella psychromarinicola]MCL1084405.1 CidA/LrgA family protein [Shewanella psychromarinicola]RPA22413.1 CidA/LrgA family protein [Shewanella psychromarinicola]